MSWSQKVNIKYKPKPKIHDTDHVSTVYCLVLHIVPSLLLIYNTYIIPSACTNTLLMYR